VKRIMWKMRFFFPLLALLGIYFLSFYYLVHTEIGDSDYGVGIILDKKLSPQQVEVEPGTRLFEVKVKVIRGKKKGRIFLISHLEFIHKSFYNLVVKTGDKVVIYFFKDEEGNLQAGIDAFYSSKKILLIIFIFISSVLVVAKIKGLKSLVSLFLTLILIFRYMSSFILKGYSPLLLAVVFSLLITFLTFLIIGGLNKKTLAAMGGTLGGVITAGVLGHICVNWLQLSGVGESETAILQNLSLGIDLQQLLLAGIVIGALGAVMDVAVSIASSIEEIKNANPSYNFSKLFKSGLKIGEDIIGTMTNTLVLAYAGSSFSTILLFVVQNKDFPLIRILNMEMVSIEIIRSLMGSIGMVLAIPLTAAISSFLYSIEK